MITKDELCWKVIHEFCDENKIAFTKENVHNILPGYIGQSSNLAVALEHLNFIQGARNKDYAKDRSGTILMGDVSSPDQGHIFGHLSLRELLDLLPYKTGE